MLHAHLQAHSVARSFVGAELDEMREIRTAETTSRSIVGVMNEFKYLTEVHARLDGETDLLAVSQRSAETPCGPRYTRHISPDSEPPYSDFHRNSA